MFGQGVAAVGSGGQGWMREDELALAGDEGLVRALRFGRCGLVRWSRLLFVARQERVEMTMRGRLRTCQVFSLDWSELLCRG